MQSRIGLQPAEKPLVRAVLRTHLKNSYISLTTVICRQAKKYEYVAGHIAIPKDGDSFTKKGRMDIELENRNLCLTPQAAELIAAHHLLSC